MVNPQTIGMGIKNGVKGSFQGISGVIFSFFRRFGWRWGITTIIVIIIFGSSIINSIQARSPIVFLEEFVGRIALSDHTVEEETKNILSNPQIEAIRTDLHQYDASLPIYKKTFIYPYNFFVNCWVKFKYYISRFSVFFTLIVNIWFLYIVTWLLMKFSMKFIIQDDSKSTSAWVMAILLMLLLQMVFSAATYEKPDSWSEMNLIAKTEKVMPFRGTIFMFSNIGKLLDFGMERIVEPIRPLDINESIDIINNNILEV